MGLTIYVCLSDAALASQDMKMMSEVFEDSLRHPLRRYPVILAWGIVTAHLFTYGDTKYKKVDPIHNLGKVVTKGAKKLA